MGKNGLQRHTGLMFITLHGAIMSLQENADHLIQADMSSCILSKHCNETLRIVFCNIDSSSVPQLNIPS